MKKFRLIPLLAVSLAMIACSLTGRQNGTPTPPDEPVQAVQASATPRPTATALQSPTQAAPTSSADESDQPYQVTGTFSFSNDIITTYYIEHAVALVDMYGFVIRDEEWEMPVTSQTLGFLDLDPQSRQGSFTLQLPARPTGVQADLNPDGEDETGVKVYTVAYFPNLTGGPYSVGDDRSLGWPSYLTSAKADS